MWNKDKPKLKPRLNFKESNYVLVCNSYGIINVGVYREYPKHGEFTDGWYDKNNNILSDIIAWMELPTPPERTETMKGSIEYLRKIRDICQEHNGDCKKCPLGEKKVVTDNICPRLTHPINWDDERISIMVKV